MKNVPRSLAVIPDGNRRCAKRLMLQPWKGHEWGAKKLEEVFGWCRELGIKDLTFYTLSLENLESRPKTELNHLYDIARKEFKRVNTDRSHFVHRDKVRLYFFGDLEKLPKDLQEEMRKAQEMTRSYSRFRINYAVAYGGRQEIVGACRKLAAECSDPNSISEEMLRHSLQTNGSLDPDLIIRTGGEKRLSNFLLFQSAYSELSFIDSFWPDLTKEQFVAAIKDFANRKRRFGK
ncbi:MAG: di-trans,poly-cis-decaprenylcistransferase [Candidatus Aenigmarchaeota archaeon]|nr:di-trans,poly-cis-decaprenylcistransferase [Candidatus Aenigmarchaeota archaeon]